MHRRLGAAATAALLGLGLVACGGSSSTSSTGSAGSTSGGASSQAGSSGGKCDSSDAVKVGTIYSMSGPAAGIGKLAQQGAQMAVADINAAGGILGRCVDEILKDDGGDPTKAAQVARQLVNEDEVDFVVGPFLSSPTSVTLDVTTPAKVIEIVESALTASGDASKYPYAFRTEVNTDQQAKSFLPFIQSHGWKKVGILAVNNELGSGFVDSFKPTLAGTGITVVDEQTTDSGAPDVTPQVTALKQAGADVIIAALTADPDQTAVIKARNRLGWDVPILGFSSMTYPGTMDNFSKSEAHDVYAGQIYKNLTYKKGHELPSSEAARKFIAEYKDKLGTDKLDFSVQQSAGAYDSFMLAAQAIDGAGALDSDKVKQYLESHTYDGVRGHYTYSAERHDGYSLDDIGWAIAKSFNDNGIVQIAPGS